MNSLFTVKKSSIAKPTDNLCEVELATRPKALRLKVAFQLFASAWLVAWGAVNFCIAQDTVELPDNFVAELNRRLESIPEDERAWPVYREALLELGNLNLLPEQFTPMHARGLKQIRDYLESNRKAIAKLHQATKLRALGYPLSDGIPMADSQFIPGGRAIPGSANPPLMDLKLLAPQLLAEAAKVLLAEAALAQHEQDHDQFEQSVVALFGLAEHISEHDMLITENLARSVVQLTITLIRDGLEDPNFELEVDQLATISKLLDSYAKAHQEIGLDGALLLFRDIVQRHYTDDGAGDGVFRDPETGRTNRLIASRREMLDRAEELYAAAKDELAQPARKVTKFAILPELIQLDESQKYHLLSATFPNVFSSYCDKEIVLLQIAGIRTAIAIELYRRKNGEWPKDLPMVSPQFIDELPIDRFFDSPLQYRIRDRRPMLYSIGPNRRDGDGKVVSSDPAEWKLTWHQSLMQGTPARNEDWILWQQRLP